MASGEITVDAGLVRAVLDAGAALCRKCDEETDPMDQPEVAEAVDVLRQAMSELEEAVS